MKKSILLLGLIVVSLNYLFAQTNKDSVPVIPEKHTVIAHIFSEAYYSFNDNVIPRQAFRITRGLLGYVYNYNDRLKALLIYDVTRTTREIVVRDTAGNILPVEYKDGSRYTGFLKLAEIDYKLTDWLEIGVGQMMTKQYTPLRDYWGYSYISNTFEEINGFGMPADFGVMLMFRPTKNIEYTFGVFNGEGPFQYQDASGNMLISNNLEIKFANNLLLKLYHDYDKGTIGSEVPRTTYQVYLAYLTPKLRFGASYHQIDNPKFVEDKWWGVSLHGNAVISPKFDLLFRCDYMGKSNLYEDSQYWIGGFQYKPMKRLSVSLNFRHRLPENQPQIFMNMEIRY